MNNAFKIRFDARLPLLVLAWVVFVYAPCSSGQIQLNLDDSNIVPLEPIQPSAMLEPLLREVGAPVRTFRRQASDIIPIDGESFMILNSGSSHFYEPDSQYQNDWQHQDSSQPILQSTDNFRLTNLFEIPSRCDTTPCWAKLIEFGPNVLSKPNKPLAMTLGCIFQMEHDEVESELSEIPIGLQPIPDRPNLILEWNEKFLSPGWLNQGIEIPTGAVWRPSVWVFGQYRTAFQYFDRDRTIDPVVQQAVRLDLFAQLNLTATERVLIGVRPLDEEEGGSRQFSGYDFHDGKFTDGWNARIQTLFFEGDFGELFPNLDPYDSRSLDFGFSVGRMPLLAQQGLLLNEDMIDAVTMTRNTLSGNGNLNLRMTGVYSWSGINRNSPVGRPNDYDRDGKMVALLTETDFFHSTVNIDGVYVESGDGFGDLLAVGISSIRRHHLYDNTYNTSLHLLASFPGGESTDYAQQGELLFAQTSWTPHHTEDLIYVNSFLAIDQFTSPARGPANGNAIDQVGILFSGVALGNYGAPISALTNDQAGASIGYQMFFDQTRSQVIWEFGGAKETKGPSQGAIGTAMRVQKAFGQHLIGVLDAFVTKPESQNAGQGLRAELLVRF